MHFRLHEMILTEFGIYSSYYNAQTIFKLHPKQIQCTIAVCCMYVMFLDIKCVKKKR
jgi:hypothetical protein